MSHPLPSPAWKAVDLRGRALVHYRRREFASCIAVLSELVETGYVTADDYRRLGWASTWLEHNDEAVEAYTNAIKLLQHNPSDPSQWPVFLDRGHAHARAERYQDALDDYSVAITHRPQHIESYSCRAGMYRRLGQFDKALEDVSTAIAESPLPTPELYTHRGLCYCLLERPELAQPDFDRAIATLHHVVPRKRKYCYNDRALARILAGEFSDAVLDLDEVITIVGPTGQGDVYWEARARWHKGYCLGMLGEFRLALSELERCFELHQDWPDLEHGLMTIPGLSDNFFAILHELNSSAVARSLKDRLPACVNLMGERVDWLWDRLDLFHVSTTQVEISGGIGLSCFGCLCIDVSNN